MLRNVYDVVQHSELHTELDCSSGGCLRTNCDLGKEGGRIDLSTIQLPCSIGRKGRPKGTGDTNACKIAAASQAKTTWPCVEYMSNVWYLLQFSLWFSCQYCLSHMLFQNFGRMCTYYRLFLSCFFILSSALMSLVVWCCQLNKKAKTSSSRSRIVLCCLLKSIPVFWCVHFIFVSIWVFRDIFDFITEDPWYVFLLCVFMRYALWSVQGDSIKYFLDSVERIGQMVCAICFYSI